MRNPLHFPYSPSFSCLLLSVLVGLLLSDSRMHASDIPEQELVPATGENSGGLRFDLYQGYFMVAHGSAGPLKNLNLFLDTGTNRTVLDERIVKKLGVPREESTDIAVIGGRVKGAEIKLPSLELGTLKVSNLQIVTTDLSFFQKFFPVHIDAIVGIDVLGIQPFMIDYAAHVIRFGQHASAFSVSVPLRLYHGMGVFDAEVDHTRAQLVFDTGAGSIILFDRPGPGAIDPAIEVPQAIGDFGRKQVWLRALKLGPAEYRWKQAFIASNPNTSHLDYDGVMSPPALGITRVFVDLQGGRFAFSR